MKLLFLDFETYWDSKAGYTLTKMPTEEYVRHKDFHAFGCGLQLGDSPIIYVRHEQLPTIFNRIPWDDVAMVCQNIAFDGFILSEVYGYRPKMYIDTASMYRGLYPNRSASLKNICESLGFPPKGNEAMKTDGKRTLTEEEHHTLGEYCKKDVLLTRMVFDELKARVPLAEMKLMHITARWFNEPILRLNTALLERTLAEEITAKENLYDHVQTTKEELRSSDKFAELLRSLGVTPPIKVSPAAVKKDKSIMDKANSLRVDGQLDADILDEYDIPWTYAFSKTDKPFQLLLESDDPIISALCEARLGAKSTLSQSRTERLLGISQRGTLPIPLFYWGAATGRWSATGKINVQNFPRGGVLRESIEAPEGYSIVVRDLAGIEARVLAFVAGQDNLTSAYKEGRDTYCEMASSIYQRAITKKDEKERHVGKTVVLGSGYGMGYQKLSGGLPVQFTEADLANFPDVNADWFLSNKRNFSFTNNNKPSNVTQKDFEAHCAISSYITNTYRDWVPKIVELWRECDNSLMHIHQGREVQIGAIPGLITTCAEGLRFPSGRYIRYFELTPQLVNNRMQWTRATKEGPENIYGGLVCQNAIQAIARHIIADQLLEIEALGWRSVSMTHDELIFVVKDEDAERCMADVERIMKTPPKWIPGVPLNSDGGIAKNYKEAK